MKPDGGPAFPIKGHARTNEGITLRDCFAIAAMLRYSPPLADDELRTVVARHCWQYADAMLAERDK